MQVWINRREWITCAKILNNMTAIPAQESKQAGAKGKLYTIEEYLALEENALVNHEYDNGKRIPVAGGTHEHSKIKARLIAALINAIDQAGENFAVFNSDIRIQIPALNKFLMPDAAVAIETSTRNFPEAPVGVLTTPFLIVEVLSKDSESYDRGEKFARYRTLPSFVEYVLVSQKEPRIETFAKKDGKWFLNEDAAGLDAEVELVSLGVKIALRDVYRNVQFAAEGKKPRRTRKS